ncbi:hypothetical protein SEA_WHEELBITE_49 [Arthrobacter phage Wheelbite]|uniref:Uncharacterized protein n=1 Tax=Arthrobacter phage Wheelbite TaxID=2015873 RepID=A0A222ZJD4_9CAUD|nr:hypothetical protein KMD23_gp49 [Arthrobacter phage Wheelbite]ASR84140.1 hypothetical protein SEA_WHEELBITE_49 [Arthrobacter phage Wheelbite]
MNPMTLPPDEVHPHPLPGHNHVTRDMKMFGEGCPSCDSYWRREQSKNLTDAEAAWEDVETMGPLTEADRKLQEDLDLVESTPHAFRGVAWLNATQRLDAAGIPYTPGARYYSAPVVDADDRTVTVEIPAPMAAHMQRHAVGGYSIASTAKPGMVWPL